MLAKLHGLCQILNWTLIFLDQVAVQHYKVAQILFLLEKILEMYSLLSGNF